MAREAIDPSAELQPALPMAEADRGTAAGLRRRLRLDASDRRLARRPTPAHRRRRRRGRVPAVGPAQPIRLARRRLDLATLRIDGPTLDERRRHEAVALLRVSGPLPRPQPGDARRRVAGATLVPGRATTPDRRPRRQRIVAEPGRGRVDARGYVVPFEVAQPGERLGRIRVWRHLWLAPWRHLPDERDPGVELAHPVDEAMSLGLRRRQRLGRFPFARPLEELRKAAVRLQVAPDHDRVVGLERLGHPVDERPREPERDPHLADRRTRPVGHEVADHPRVLRSVAVVDVLDDLLPPRRAEVDVDVRIGRPALVDEPLEEQVVLDRLDPADPEGVGDDRARRAAATLGRDALLPGEPHQVPADQEELGEPGPLDHIELVGEPLDDGRGQRVIALPGAGLAQLDEIRERGLALRHREAREAVLLEAEIDRARRRQLDRRGDPLAPRPRRLRVERRTERRQLVARLEVRLAVRPAQVGERLERPAVLDRGEDVVQLTVVGRGVVDVVGDDDRQPELGGERRRLRHEPVVVGQEVMRELDEEAARGGIVATPEQRRVALRDRPRPRSIAHPQATRDLPVATARQRDEAFVMLVEEGLAEARHALGPGQVRARDEPRQAPPADRRAGQQHEMRAARPLADPAQVLLDRVAVAGQTGALGAGPGRTAFRDDRLRSAWPPPFARVDVDAVVGRPRRPGRGRRHRAARSPSRRCHGGRSPRPRP